jgi:hypothetical protein
MSDLDDDTGIVYRGLYGHAARLIEVAEMSLYRGRDKEGATRDREELIAAVSKPGVPLALVKMAVDDALAGRRPRW